MYDPFDSLVGRQPQSPSTGLRHNLEGARAANPSQGGSQPSAWQGAQPQPRYQYHQNQPQLQPRLHTQQHNLVGGGVDGQGYQHGVRYYSTQQQQQQQQQPGFVSSVGYTPRTQPGQHVTPAMAPWGGLASVPGAMANVPSPSAGVGYASQQLQQQQQPQQQRQQQHHLPPHSVTQQQGRTGHLVWDKPTQSATVFLPSSAQTLTTTNIVGLTTAAPVTPQSTPHLSSPLGGADARTDGGAEWLPPGEQLASYESMFTAASAGSAVPGTVSGRAAVQFFSRSGLPKDVLKTIWSLCDPTLTGSIRRPGFFAAMRLISIAQGHHPGTVASSAAKDPPYLRAALERTRHAPLPPPRMGNLNSSLPAPEAVGASSGGEGKPHPVTVSAPLGLAPASLGAPSFPGGGASFATAAPTAAAAAAAWTNDVTTAWIAAAGAPSGANDRSVGGVHAGATGVSPPVGAAALPPAPAGSAGGGDRGSVPSPFDGLLSVAKPSGAVFGSVSVGEGDGIAVNPAEQALDGKTVAAEREKEQGGGGDDDEDFGDFEGAEDPSLAEPPPLPLAPLVAAVETVSNDEEDFGDFSGAPDGEEAFAGEANSNSTIGTAFAAVTVTAASPVASASVRDGGRSEEAGEALDAGETWTMGSGGEWPTEAMGKVDQGGLDEMMRSNLDEAAAGAVHLADMQSTPSLLGKSHDPVMVDRADAGGSNKLSVFDAMADLDLAVGQEEWNDFADETTAPPRSPTPPPSTPLEVVVEESEEVAVAAAAAVDATAVDVSGVKAEEVPVFSMGRGVEGFPSVTPTDAEDGGESDDWGAFEDAGEALAAVAAALVVEKAIEAPVMISSEAEKSEEEWGEFEEVPAGEEVGAGAGDDGSAGQEPVCVKAGGDDFARGTAVWGNVDEDAEEALAAVAAAIVVEKVVVAPAKISLEAEGSEDWGGFEEVPVAEAGEEVGASHDGSVGQEPLYAKTGGDDLAPATAVEDPTGETRAGSTEAAEPDDPFADIAPRTPLPPARPLGSPMAPLEIEDRTLSGGGVVERGNALEGQKEGRQDGESGDSEKGSPGSVEPEQPGASSVVGTKRAEAVEEFQRVMAAGLPLPLRALRDALSARGRLEEAAEVERRMELPALPTRKVGVEGDETATGAEEGAGAEVTSASGDDITGTKGINVVGGCGSGGDGEDLRVDLERWRAAAEEPPSPTIEELAGRVAAVDAGRGERFLERFVRGRPPVEEEALAHGGAVALGAALERQRAARRAAYVSRALGSLSAITRNEDNATEKEPELELDLGLHSSHARATASLSDWARMTAFVARALQAGLAAISNSEGSENNGSRGGEGSEGGSATIHSLAPPPPLNHHQQQEQQGINARVSTEVARSAKFEAFCRGLGEAVAVCRMLQASAVDSLTGVEGFEDLERSWGEFQRRARDKRRGGGGASGCSNGRESSGKVIPVAPGLGVEGDGGEEEEWLAGGTGDKDGVCGSVAGIREAVGRRAPAGSALCAVCLQPLEVFAGASLGLSEVEYCGVQYFASAINLWVNALDKAPPSAPLSQRVFEDGEPAASTTL